MKVRVFVGEDDESMRRLLEEELAADGYEVLATADGADTIDVLSKAHRQPLALPDVILLDMHMPRYSGLEILLALREAGWTTPVILMTAFGDAGMRDEALRSGADAVFEKPFDMTDLRLAVRRCWVERMKQAETAG